MTLKELVTGISMIGLGGGGSYYIYHYMPTKTDGQELAKLAIYSIVGLAGMVVGGMFIGRNARENRNNDRRDR